MRLRLETSIARHLRLAGALRVLDSGRLAVAAGLGGSPTIVSEAPATGVPRSRATIAMSDHPCRVLPDESVSSAALERGADEVGRELATALIEAFRR